MIHESPVLFRRELRGIVTVDPTEPLLIPRRPEPAPLPGPTPETLSRLRDAIAAEAEQVEQAAREERAGWTRLVAGLTEVARELRAQQRSRLEEMQRVAVELAVAIASHVVCERIESGDYAIEELVRQAVKRMEPREAVTVYLNPDDLTLLERRLGDGPLLSLEGEDVRLLGDASLGRGDVRAESGDVNVVSQMEEHLAELRSGLLRVLPDAEIERRKSISDDRGLRRFPDRRHTA